MKEAVQMAYEAKLKLPRANSHKQYNTTTRHFLKWATRAGAHKWPIEQFTRRHAREYWDALTTEKKLRPRSQADYLATMRALWSEMIEREMVEENPWKRIKPPRKDEKTRRPFTDTEKRVVAAYIERTNYWLFRGLLLQYFCFIRPVELCRLKFKDFDLGRGLVTVRESEAKTWRKRVKTIPASVLHYFRDGQFDRQPTNWHVFGRVGDKRRGHLGPAPDPIHENRMSKTHAKILKRLLEAGDIHDIKGLCWYSWKDTGISAHVAHTSPIATRDQAGHQSFSMTEVYYHRPEVIEQYRLLENDLAV